MKRDYRTNGDYQEKVRALVSREVFYCVSTLISELAKKAEAFPEYQEDIYNLCWQPATEEEIKEGYEDGSEVFEHWIVSDWLADRLEKKGCVIARDFFGMTVWGRTTTGQAIFIDSVICDIYDDVQNEIAGLSTI